MAIDGVGRQLEVAAGVPTIGTWSNALRMRSLRALMSATSWSPARWRRRPSSVSLLADRCERVRACSPSAATSFESGELVSTLSREAVDDRVAVARPTCGRCRPARACPCPPRPPLRRARSTPPRGARRVRDLPAGQSRRAEPALSSRGQAGWVERTEGRPRGRGPRIVRGRGGGIVASGDDRSR